MSAKRSATGVPGATIREVPFISDVLPGAVPAGEFSVARPGALLRVIPGLARFLVRDGLTIDVAIEPGADRDAVQEFLDGAVLGALIHQRGELPLHAATLVPPGAGAAIAIAGGFTPRANQESVDITRDINGKVMTGRVVTSDPLLPGDTVYGRERLF